MFIKRAAIDDIGRFDAETFGAGYGEENDFSLRAMARGWRNVCATDVYVAHIGAVSFSQAREARLVENLRRLAALHPYYDAWVADFIRNDPLHDVRNRVQKALWRRHSRIALMVTLALEGGAVRHAQDMMARLTAEGWLALALSATRDAEGRPVLRITRFDSAEALCYPASAPPTEPLADILDLAPRLIHVQHVIDLPEAVGAFVRDCGIPYAVTLHDFFYACPKVTLLDEGGAYCGMPAAEKCTDCVRHGPIHPQVHPSLASRAENGTAWRASWLGLLREAAQVIAPSQDTADRYAHLLPGIAASVRPHPAPVATTSPAAPAAALGEGVLRVAVPGAIGPQKGARQLLDLVRHCARWQDDIRFAIVGHCDRETALAAYGNITLCGSFTPGEAVPALRGAGCHVALLLSIFPETFSYMLSETLAAGLVPVAYDFGAIGERLRALGVGVLVPLGAPPERIVEALRQAAAMPRPTLPQAALYGQYDGLMRDYYAPALANLVEAIEPPDRPRVLAWPAGLEPDGWCGGEVRLQLWLPRPAEQLRVAFWVPAAGQMQAVDVRCNSRLLTRSFLDAEATTRVTCQPTPQDGRFLDLTLRFDFVFRLRPPDIRSCAGTLSGIEIREGGFWRRAEMPLAPQMVAAG
jgi:glycosyltransferase involved in cell wall biosynthesis